MKTSNNAHVLQRLPLPVHALLPRVMMVIIAADGWLPGTLRVFTEASRDRYPCCQSSGRSRTLRVTGLEPRGDRTMVLTTANRPQQLARSADLAGS